MNNLLEYKGFYGSVEFSAADRVFFGKLEFINDLVNYEAEVVKDIEKAFHEAVENYLETCKEIGKS